MAAAVAVASFSSALASPASAAGPGGAVRPPAGQEGAGSPGGGDGLAVYLLTFGPGDRVWERFGHNALLVRDSAAGTEQVYNWGIFDFEQEDFLPRLLSGRMRYRLGRTTLGRTVAQYRSANRTVRARRLRLAPAQRRRLQELARINYRPENRFYAYDPYRDNCSTRVRDLLDRVLDGRIRRATAGRRTDRTYRSHTRRLMRRDPWPYLGLMVALASPLDRRVTEWEAMFLPLQLEQVLLEVRVPDGQGGRAGLLGPARTLYRASRPPVPTAPPDRTLTYLLTGLAAGALLGLLAWLARIGEAPAARRGFGLLAGLWSLVAGAGGVLMVLGWTATDHWYVYRNENLFQLQPLWLALAVLVPAATWQGRWRRPALWTGRLCLAVALAGAALQALPGFDQVNGEVLALLLPIHVGAVGGLELLLGADEGT